MDLIKTIEILTLHFQNTRVWLSASGVAAIGSSLKINISIPFKHTNTACSEDTDGREREAQ